MTPPLERSKSDFASIGVGILTANRPHQLRESLRHLSTGSRLPDQIVVLNNSPNDPVPPILQEFPNLNIRILQGDYLEYAAARNLVVEALETEFIAFLDDDCYADASWLELLHEGLREYDAVGGLVLPASPLRSPQDWHPELNWLLGLSTPSALTDSTGMRVLPSTSNMGFRKKVWEEVRFQELGGRIRDHAMGNYALGGEDAAFWRGVRNAGFRTVMIPEAVVFHDISGERYAVRNSLERAKKDGQTSWVRRSDAGRDIDSAVADVLETPLRPVWESWKQPEKRPALRRMHRTWGTRQRAFLGAALGDGSRGISRPSLATKVAKRLIGLPVSLGKNLLRKGVVAAQAKLVPPSPFIPNPNRDQTIGIVSSPFLGDTLLLLPLIQQMAQQRPRWKFRLFVSQIMAELVQAVLVGSKNVEVIGFQYRSTYRSQIQLARELFTHPCDVLFFTYLHQFNPLAFHLIPRLPIIAWREHEGRYLQIWKDLAWRTIPMDPHEPEQTSLRRLLAPLQIPLQRRDLRIDVEQVRGSRVSQLLDRHDLVPNRFVVILMDGREDEFKSWPVEHYALLAEKLVKESGFPIVFEGTRSGRAAFEQCLLLCPSLKSPEVVSFHGYLNLRELADFLSAARLVVGIDSGPIHLARSMGTPTLTLFGATSEKRWGVPRSATHRSLRGERAPFEWSLREAEVYSHNEHLRRLSPERVAEVALEMLDQSVLVETSSLMG